MTFKRKIDEFMIKGSFLSESLIRLKKNHYPE